MKAVRGVSPGWFNFYKLNAQARPGLTAKEFFDLFTQCRCGLIMTRAGFSRHHCKFTVIDLTNETEDEEATMVDLTLNEQ